MLGAASDVAPTISGMGPVGFLGPGFAACSVMYIILADSWSISVLDSLRPSDLDEVFVGSKFCSAGGRWSCIVIVTIVVLERAAGRFRGRTDGRGASQVAMTRVVCECWTEIMATETHDIFGKSRWEVMETRVGWFCSWQLWIKWIARLVRWVVKCKCWLTELE